MPRLGIRAQLLLYERITRAPLPSHPLGHSLPIRTPGHVVLYPGGTTLALPDREAVAYVASREGGRESVRGRQELVGREGALPIGPLAQWCPLCFHRVRRESHDNPFFSPSEPSRRVPGPSLTGIRTQRLSELYYPSAYDH